MYTISKNSIYQYEIQKSKFITLLYKVTTIEEVNFYLEQVKTLYKDATHYCFAYKIQNIQKFSDDKEPSGTAGLPIMEVLSKKDLDQILCIVVRYFGGIKLGAGGLTRAYSKAVSDALLENKIIELEKGYSVKIIANYDEQKTLDHLFSNQIKEKEFLEQITYIIDIFQEQLEMIQNYDYEILEEKMIEKEFK